MSTYRPGDIVRQKTETRLMTVIAVSKHMITCEWIEAGEKHQAFCLPENLVPCGRTTVKAG